MRIRLTVPCLKCIIEYVPNGVFDALIPANDVIVKARLPQLSLPIEPPAFVGRLALELADDLPYG